LRAFQFTNAFPHTNFDAPGIDLSIDLQVNGRSLSIQYDKLQAPEDLPPGVGSLLALLRRNLPASYSRFFDYLRVPTLPPLTGEDATRYRQCALHHEWMKVDEVRVAYGLSCPTKAYSEAHKKLFPNACLYSNGGCVVTPNGSKTTKVRYCDSCRQAAAEWQKKHGQTP
jgi:hypothetical protein